MAETIARPMIRKFKLSDLELAAYNPRNIADAAFQGLQESLKELGMLEMPVVNIKDGKRRLVSGHQRVNAMIATGVTHADCAVVSFDDVQEQMANLTMNNPAIQGQWDVSKAVPQLVGICADLPKPSAMCFSILSDEIKKEADKIAKAAEKKTAADNETPETPHVPVSKPGKIYKLGKHRLYCGSSFTGAALLLGKKHATACITDPPYNVAYESAAGESIENDDMKNEEWLKFIDTVSSIILSHVDGPCYVFMASKELPALSQAWLDNGGVLHRWLVWVKDRFTLSRGDYHHQYEPFLYGWRSGITPETPKNPRTSVFEFPKPSSNALHPTQKPVDLFKAIVNDCSVADDVIFDPFLGSGTTLVVCEELGRVCYGCELDLFYCDTIRKRYAEQVHGQGCDWNKLTDVAR